MGQRVVRISEVNLDGGAAGKPSHNRREVDTGRPETE